MSKKKLVQVSLTEEEYEMLRKLAFECRMTVNKLIVYLATRRMDYLEIRKE